MKYAAVKGSRGPERRCWAYWIGPIRTAHEAKNNTEPMDHRMANLRGFIARTGKRKKQITKQTKAAALHPPKTRSRSHRLSAKKPSSSSLRVGAGNGAPGASCVGSLTYPASPKGFSDCNLDRIGFCDDVLTGTSASRRDQPMEFNDSRNEVEAMFDRQLRQPPPTELPCRYYAPRWLEKLILRRTKGRLFVRVQKREQMGRCPDGR